MNDISTQKVRELLERIHELEEERDSLIEVKDALLEVAERFVKERNAALERVRELEPILEAALIMDTKTQNHWAALESGNPELLKPEVRSQSYAQMITAEKKVFDLIKPFRKIEAQQ